jgi:transposase
MPKIQKRKSTSMPVLSCLELNAAGVDVGATEIYIAVPADRDPQPVRRFSTFTEDLHVAADWLKACGIETVAMESTGVYWIPFFQILEARGFRVLLANAHHVKNVPGRKSDVSDCQWIQYLLSVGLLRASFRPEQAVCTVRSILRHRDNLVQLASTHIQHIQKALDQMNLQLHHVISDITGLTGMATVEAILEGKRDPLALAKLRDPRINATENTIAKALVGDYRPDHLLRFASRLPHTVTISS